MAPTREKGKVRFAGAAEPSSKEKIPITELAEYPLKMPSNKT
jgi:hypothetical protein